MIKVALIGYGKMGQIIDNIAPVCGAEIVSRIDPKAPKANWKDINEESLAAADVCIDFSHPDAVLNTLKKIAPSHKPVVIGTTGWYDHMGQVQDIVDKFGLGVIYAQNFSVGMNLFMKIVQNAGKLINGCANYDVAVSEIHHNQKIDSPSGTARAIANILLENNSRKKKLNCHLGNEKIAPDELQVSSVRVGTVPGTHTVLFNSEQDTITLTHQAHHRTAWAEGALTAAKWIRNKKGFYNITDMMEE